MTDKTGLSVEECILFLLDRAIDAGDHHYPTAIKFDACRNHLTRLSAEVERLARELQEEQERTRQRAEEASKYYAQNVSLNTEVERKHKALRDIYSSMRAMSWKQWSSNAAAWVQHTAAQGLGLEDDDAALSPVPVAEAKPAPTQHSKAVEEIRAFIQPMRKSMEKYKAAGYGLVFYSCRLAAVDTADAILAILEKHGGAA